MRSVSRLKNLKYLLLWGIVFPMAGCVKDKPNPPAGTELPAGGGRRVLIANEGSLGNGNASLSVYNIDSNTLVNNVYVRQNGIPLGDVFQSMIVIDDRLFLALNNSDKIVVVDKHTFALIGEINVKKPREMLPVGDDKLYVSSLFYPEIHIVDLNTLQVTGKINTDFPGTEGMLRWQGSIYACNWDTACDYIYEINPHTDEIVDRIPIAGSAPQQILIDKHQNLWVLAGNVYKGKRGTLTCIDPRTETILRQFLFPPQAEMIKPVFNAGSDTLYFLGVNYNGATTYNGVFRMSIGRTTLPAQPFIPARPLQYFWGLGIDPVTGNIYVGDPKGFIQKGAVLIYSPSGKRLETLDVNIGPGCFYFMQP